MKKNSYAWRIALLLVVIGAVHIYLFTRHPYLPPVPKTEVIWGDLNDKQPSPLQSLPLDTNLCAVKAVMPEKGGDDGSDNGKRVRFEYRPEAQEFLNTGRAAQIVMERGSVLTLGKESYPLVKIQFERSRTTGQPVFYLIHRMKEGKVVVVSVPLQVSGQDNEVIATLWRYLPHRAGEHNTLYDVHVDINKLLPHDRTYYRYAAAQEGCAKEAVLLSLVSPVQISAAQMTKLDEVLAAPPTASPL